MIFFCYYVVPAKVFVSNQNILIYYPKFSFEPTSTRNIAVPLRLSFLFLPDFVKFFFIFFLCLLDYWTDRLSSFTKTEEENQASLSASKIFQFFSLAVFVRLNLETEIHNNFFVWNCLAPTSSAHWISPIRRPTWQKLRDRYVWGF